MAAVRLLGCASVAEVAALDPRAKGKRVTTTDVGGLPRMPGCGRIIDEHLL
ncbi:MAG: hypothetical protein OXM03_00510 [Chloroflexota bacterium]|nr:hypothetical protein [Chloroflexota bacterium]